MKKNVLQEMVYLGGNENDKMYENSDNKVPSLIKYEEKIEEINQIITEQEKEIESLKIKSSTSNSTSKSQNKVTSNLSKLSIIIIINLHNRF